MDVEHVGSQFWAGRFQGSVDAMVDALILRCEVPDPGSPPNHYCFPMPLVAAFLSLMESLTPTCWVNKATSLSTRPSHFLFPHLPSHQCPNLGSFVSSVWFQSLHFFPPPLFVAEFRPSSSFAWVLLVLPPLVLSPHCVQGEVSKSQPRYYHSRQWATVQSMKEASEVGEDRWEISKSDR